MPILNVSRSSRSRRFWSLLRLGFDSTASSSGVERRRRTWLMTTSSASSAGSPGASARRSSSSVVGFWSATSRISFSGRSAISQRSTSGGLPLSLPSASALSAASSRSALSAAERTSSSPSASRNTSSSARSTGLRGSAPWAAMSRRSRGIPPRRNWSTRGLALRASAIRESAAGRRIRGRVLLDERRQALARDDDVLLHLPALAEGDSRAVIDAKHDSAGVADRQHDLALGVQGLVLARREDAVQDGVAIDADAHP